VTQLAAVLWSGAVGGAETFTIDLCRAIRGHGADVGVLFVCDERPLGTRLQGTDIRQTSLGLGRGREVLRRPRMLAAAVQDLGPDGVILPSGGYLAPTLRVGGYRGRIATVQHDVVTVLPAHKRIIRHLDRMSSFWANDVDIAVSEFARARLKRLPYARKVIRIYNGVDLEAYQPGRNGASTGAVVIGCAGRLIPGKGMDTLVRAFAHLHARSSARLRIAGDGPERQALEQLAKSLGISDAIEFLGWTADIAEFWRGCDVAVMPSDAFIESFGMVVVEAMACGRPVVATRNGALPELVLDRVNGRLVSPGEPEELAEALLELTRDEPNRRVMGSNARARCRERFDISRIAREYLDVFDGGVTD
jgi:glycosyltransferase involved in cell wall biosynthesis